jgi:hypothetical protein
VSAQGGGTIGLPRNRSSGSATLGRQSCERSSAAEHQLPKLRTRVRFPSLALGNLAGQGTASIGCTVGQQAPWSMRGLAPPKLRRAAKIVKMETF